jgi:aryl-alcohol dehydrogenase
VPTDDEREEAAMAQGTSSADEAQAAGVGTITATAAVLEEVDAPLSLQEVQVDAPAEGEVRVRMRGVGICHTDISAAHGLFPLPLPTVLGHEGSGVVEAVGPGVEGLEVGDHVALSFDHCGECPQCEAKLSAYCDLFAPLNYFGTRLDGSVTLHSNGDDVHGSWFGQSSFATYAIASVHNAVKVPKDLPPSVAVCRPAPEPFSMCSRPGWENRSSCSASAEWASVR